MSSNPNTYLVQVRDQIASAFNLEELRTIAFDLQLDWDELEGSRKTNRIQDLITQMARNGRLEDLIELLRQKRPKETWPDIPSPEQQQQDIRTAFPSKPLYQQTWLWAIVLVFLVIVAIGLATRLPQSIVSAIPTDTPIPTATITPSPTPTPLPFLPAAEDETLIVITTFYRTEGVVDVDAHNEIRRAIQENIAALNLEKVRVAVEPTAFQSTEREQAKALGEQYDAALIIWGADTGIRQEINFLNLKEPDFAAAEATISETEKTQLSNPEAYSQFVIAELPGQLTFLSLFALGQTEYSQENYERAIELIETAVASLPDISEINGTSLGLHEAYFRLGWLYQVTGGSTQAIVAYDQAIALDPTYASALNNRGIAYAEQGEYEQAIADYTQTINLDPEDVAAFNNRGNAYADLGDYEQAIADYNQVIALDPEDAKVFYNRGIAYADLEDYEQAISDYGQAIALKPDFAEAFYNRGNVYYDLEDYEQAITNYDQAIALKPGYVDAFSNRGNIFYILENYEQAIADYDQVLALDPEDASIFFNRGSVYQDLEDYDQAFADYEQAIALNPEFAKVFNNQGVIYYFQKDYEQAITNYDQAIALNPEFYEAFNNRGNVYFDMGDFDQAIADYEQAIALNPEFAIPHLKRALVFLELENFPEALSDLQIYLELDPQSPFRESIEEMISELESELEN